MMVNDGDEAALDCKIDRYPRQIEAGLCEQALSKHLGSIAKPSARQISQAIAALAVSPSSSREPPVLAIG